MNFGCTGEPDDGTDFFRGMLIAGTAGAVMWAIIAALLFFVLRGCINENQVKASSTTDGDRLVLSDGRAVRLAWVDAPELGQDAGEQARNALAALVHDKTITLTERGRDEHGGLIATVFTDGVDVGLLMLRGGWAWHHSGKLTQEPDEHRLYAYATLQARADGIGLWSLADPIPPWEFRNRQARVPFLSCDYSTEPPITIRVIYA